MVSLDSGPAAVRRSDHGAGWIRVAVLSPCVLLAAIPRGQTALRLRDALQSQKPGARRDGPQTGPILPPGLVVRSAGTVPLAHSSCGTHSVGRASGNRRICDPDGPMAPAPS